MSESWLAPGFLAELEESVRPRYEALGEERLEVLLAEAIDEGRRAWPELELESELFIRHLAVVTDEAEPTGTISHAADLYLACSAAHGSVAAITTIERECVSKLDPALRSTGLDQAATDDVKQRVREFLFVSIDGERGIATYRGKGPLRGWLRAVAIRQAMMQFRGRREVAADDGALEALPELGNSPELAPWKEQYAAAFRAAFRRALTLLDERERTLLRQHHLDRLSIDALARLHRVHRATAARWVAAARARLLGHVREDMTAKLAIAGPELDSALRMARSRLEISIDQLWSDKS